MLPPLTPGSKFCLLLPVVWSPTSEKTSFGLEQPLVTSWAPESQVEGEAGWRPPSP